MSNTITIKHGKTIPTSTNSKLAKYELGYCTDDGKLYLNADGTIKSFLPNIENGFTLNNNVSIFSSLQDGTLEDIIFRSSSNNTWIGGRAVSSSKIGNLILAVGKGPNGDGTENVYIHRSSKGTGTTINELIYDETSIRNGFKLNNGAEIRAFLADGTTTALLIKRSSNNIWIGERGLASQGDAYIGVGSKTSSAGRLYVARGQDYVSSTDYSDISMVYDEVSIKDGFTLNNNTGKIYTYLKDGTTKANLIQRSGNHIWIGDRTQENQGNAYIGVGAAEGSTSNLYVARANINGGLYMVYDEYSIGDGFTLNNDHTLKTKLADGTKCTTLYRSTKNETWVGGSNGNGSNTSIGCVILAVSGGPNNSEAERFAYVYRKTGTTTGDYKKILDYGFVAKNLFSGTWSVGNTITISNFKDYRYFIVDIYNQAHSLVVTRRGNYLRGGVVYAQSGIVFECVRITATDAGVLTYNEGRNYTATTSGLTANWGGTTAAEDIVGVWGVL